MAKKILILAANPRDTVKVRVNQEFEEIKKIFKENDNFVVEENLAVTPDNLSETLSEHQPNIVHFIGHGRGEDGVILEDDDGLKLLVNNEGFTGIFEYFSIECLYLNSCHSVVQAKEIAQHINYVIGMRDKIENKTAKKFATKFYSQLAQGKNYESAFQFARSAVKLIDLAGEEIPIILCNPNQFQAHVAKENSSKSTEQKIDIYHLPNPSTELVGRTEELEKITNAFNDSNTHIIGIIAAGGIGKSALVDAWLKGLKEKNYNGVLRVFGWSFYSQGSHDTQTSSGQFFEKALPFFGHDLQTQPIKDDTEKGRRLAELLRNQASLLVLDGVEPLQNRAIVDGGRLKDIGLYALLRDVEKHGLAENSLVIVSSRQPLVELEKYPNYQQVDLLRLSTDDGVALLKSLRVKGLSQELETAVEAYGGHALALVLLGNLLAEYFDGDVNQHEHLPILEESEEAMEGHHAERVMGFYEKQWATDAPEQRFLNLLGLFDRPMDTAAMNALFERADIAEPLAKLSKIKWKKMLAHLRKIGLLLEQKYDFDKVSYDTHPLIRSYFGEQLKTQNQIAWQQAHLILFEFFQTVPDKHQPDTLEELEPLYRAVVHGCLAGKYKKAKEYVYQERILRSDDEGYSGAKLGAFAQDLTVISAFFPEGWKKPVSCGLSEVDQGWLLAEASFCLMSLGRLEEAVGPRKATVKLRQKLEDWENTVTSTGNFAELCFIIGQINEAKQVAQQAIEFSGLTGDLFDQMKSHARLATILHQQGDLETALKQFTIAEKIQCERQPYYPKLFSLPSVWYCTLLLDLTIDTVAQNLILERGQYSLKIVKNLLSIAFDHLTIACALFALNHFDQASNEFNQAMSGIRKAGKVQHLPEFLLERAKFHRHQKDFEKAQTDLDEAQEIIDRCGMNLYAVDAALLCGNLNLDQNQTAQTEYEMAKALIEKTGYHLRDPELDLLGTRIAFYNKELDKAQHQLRQARERLEEMGYWGLLPTWERVENEICSKANSS